MGSKDSNIRPFNSSNAPQPGGHYSQAMIYNGTIYISGQLPINPFTGEKISGGIEEQTTQVLENIRTILKDAGSSLSKVVKTTVYVSDISLWGKVNEVYAKFSATISLQGQLFPPGTCTMDSWSR
ncbi:MAG: Rid family hydrolase [Bacteroidales bacterium]